MKYCIVGFGNIGHKRFNILSDKCLVTVDPDPKTGAHFTDFKNIPLESFKNVILAVPQQLKFEMLEYFLSQGKNCLVEKPLIITSKQGQLLKKLALKNKVIWYTSYNHRFEPNIKSLKKLIDDNFLGEFYHGRFVYSFGNIKDRIGTWRETEYGVLEEIIPHVFDFIFLFFSYKGTDFMPWISRKIESRIYDHFVFSTKDKKIVIEISAVTWKNVFSIDLFGSKGSLHMKGLNKWGGSELIQRKRILPSGIPQETKLTTGGKDHTWEDDIKYFESLIIQQSLPDKFDLEMSMAINSLKI